MSVVFFPIPPLESKLVKYITLNEKELLKKSGKQEYSKVMEKQLASLDKILDNLIHTKERYAQLEINFDLNTVEDKTLMKIPYFFLFIKRSRLQLKQSKEIDSYYVEKIEMVNKIRAFLVEIIRFKLPAIVDIQAIKDNVKKELLDIESVNQRHFKINAISYQINQCKQNYLRVPIPTLDSLREELEIPMLCAAPILGTTPYTIFDRNLLEYIIANDLYSEIIEVSKEFIENKDYRKIISLESKYISMLQADTEEYQISVRCSIERIIFDIVYVETKSLDGTLEDANVFSNQCLAFKKVKPLEMQISHGTIPDEYLDQPFSAMFGYSSKNSKIHYDLLETMFHLSFSDIANCLFICSQDLAQFVKSLFGGKNEPSLAFDDFFSLFCGLISNSSLVDTNTLAKFMNHYDDSRLSQPLRFSLITFIAALDQLKGNKD